MIVLALVLSASSMKHSSSRILVELSTFLIIFIIFLVASLPVGLFGLQRNTASALLAFSIISSASSSKLRRGTNVTFAPIFWDARSYSQKVGAGITTCPFIKAVCANQ